MNEKKNAGIALSRKMKYGTLAAAFSAIFIVVVILINVFVSALDAKFGLYLDMTSEKMYDVTEASVSLLSGITDEIEIIFCAEENRIEQDYYMNLIKTLAEKYATRFANIKIKYVDVASHGKELNKYRETTSTQIATTDVIVNCAATGKFKHLREAGFFTFAESTNAPFAFNGEMRFTASILELTSKAEDKVVFTTGHGEQVTSSAIFEMLINAGYSGDKIQSVDLSTDDIPENTKLVIVNNPTNDFAGKNAEKTGARNEIDILNRYLQNFGNLLVFVDNKTGELSELKSFLNDDWGIDYHSGELIRESSSNSLTADGYTVIAEYAPSADDEYAYEITRRLSNSSGVKPKTILSNCTPIYIIGAPSRTVANVLSTSKDAEVTDNGFAVSRGSVGTFVISTYKTYVDSNLKCAHVLVCGSTEFTSSAFISSHGAAAYGNADMFYSMLNLLDNSKKVPVDIDFREFDDNSITIDMNTAKTATSVLTAAIPVIMLILGAVVFVRRKRL